MLQLELNSRIHRERAVSDRITTITTTNGNWIADNFMPGVSIGLWQVTGWAVPQSAIR